MDQELREKLNNIESELSKLKKDTEEIKEISEDTLSSVAPLKQKLDYLEEKTEELLKETGWLGIFRWAAYIVAFGFCLTLLIDFIKWILSIF